MPVLPVTAGQQIHRLSVEFLRKGGGEVVGPQSRLHMSHGNLQVETGQSGGKGGGGIPVDEDEVRLHLLQDRPHSGEDGGGNVKESLSLPHNGKVIVGDDLKNLQNLIQHLPVLPRDADSHLKACPALQLLH